VTTLELVGLWLAGAVAAYCLVILWAVYGRGAFQVVYNPVVGWLIRTLAPKMEATTIGARCFLASASTVLTADTVVHERFHSEQQWRKTPLTFIPRYFYQLARYGYGCHPMEEAARKAAGEPSECPGGFK
jgi:hypothetical protein